MDVRQGDIVRIELDDEFCCYAKALILPLACFFDKKVPRSASLGDLGEVIFKIWVATPAWKSKSWSVVGNQPLSLSEETAPEFFKKDKINGLYYKYIHGEFAPSSQADCVGLERAAVWDARHVEERLKGHFSGQGSAVEQAMKA